MIIFYYAIFRLLITYEIRKIRILYRLSSDFTELFFRTYRYIIINPKYDTGTIIEYIGKSIYFRDILVFSNRIKDVARVKGIKLI